MVDEDAGGGPVAGVELGGELVGGRADATGHEVGDGGLVGGGEGERVAEDRVEGAIEEGDARGGQVWAQDHGAGRGSSGVVGPSGFEHVKGMGINSLTSVNVKFSFWSESRW